MESKFQCQKKKERREQSFQRKNFEDQKNTRNNRSRENLNSIFYKIFRSAFALFYV